jgi:hypothetical protein
MPRTHVPANFNGGGPLDGKTEIIPLDNGRLPDEWRCPMPLPSITAEAPASPPQDVDPLRVGIYRLDSARSTGDPEGFPGDTVWVDANYRWLGER